VAVADQCAERRAYAAELLPGVRVYSHTEELLAEESIDCLDICTPPHDHTPSILAACARRVARIICEKPLTATQDEFALVSQAQVRSGSQVYTINSWLQSDLHRLVSKALRSGIIGELRSITLRTLRPDCALGVPCWQPRWRTDPALAGGGIVLDHGWHQLYMMARWMGAHPVEVAATLRTVQERHAPVEDYAMLDLEFPDARGRIELSWAAPGRTNDGEVVGTGGMIRIGDEGVTISSPDGVVEHAYGERLSDSSYHPQWFKALFTAILGDAKQTRGQENMREAQMLVDTLFKAYRPVRAATPQQPAQLEMLNA
jgi:predicted dehydrogenase